MTAKTIAYLRMYGYVIVGEYEFHTLCFTKLRMILRCIDSEKRSSGMSRFSLVNNDYRWPAC